MASKESCAKSFKRAIISLTAPGSAFEKALTNEFGFFMSEATIEESLIKDTVMGSFLASLNPNVFGPVYSADVLGPTLGGEFILNPNVLCPWSGADVLGPTIDS